MAGIGRLAVALAALTAAAACDHLDDILTPSPLEYHVASAATMIEPGWSTPSMLPVSDPGWEDSAYITRDGRFVMFFYHPSEYIFNEAAIIRTGQFDGRIFVSERPFTVKVQHPVSTDDLASEGGPYVSASGDFYYFRTPAGGGRNQIVRNGTVLDLGTGRSEQNPHYCDALGELYFDTDDEDIYVSRGGAAERLPPPINAPGSRDFQPFLTDDCQTMYFSSTRAAMPANLPLQVYRSRRNGDQWSEPELFIAHPVGVGEFSMTADGSEAVFIELRREGAGVRTDIFRSQRTGF